MILNIDLKKAFDRIEQSFVRQTLFFFNFPTKLIKLIMSCISNSFISMLVNGSKTLLFKPSMGIRQGDLMSPYIFILCMELLSRRINHVVDVLNWTLISITNGGTKVSHLFFTDDLTLFA